MGLDCGGLFAGTCRNGCWRFNFKHQSWSWCALHAPGLYFVFPIGGAGAHLLMLGMAQLSLTESLPTFADVSMHLCCAIIHAHMTGLLPLPTSRHGCLVSDVHVFVFLLVDVFTCGNPAPCILPTGSTCVHTIKVFTSLGTAVQSH